MERKTDLAIVLRSVPYDERHRVVTALTRNHGRISALARNAIQSRRFGGTLELLVASEWNFVERPGADLFRVEEAQIRRAFEGIRADFQLFSLASVFSELMMRFAPERELCEELFLLHSNALRLLEEQKISEPLFCVRILNAYIAKLLQWSGMQPRLGSCLVCEKPLQESARSGRWVKAMVADAGWSCRECRSTSPGPLAGQAVRESARQLSVAGVADLSLALGSPIRQAVVEASAELSEAREILGYQLALMDYHLGGFKPEMIKSFKLIDLGSSALPL